MTDGEQLFIAVSLASIVSGIVLMIVGGRARVRSRGGHAGLGRIVAGAMMISLPFAYLVVPILLAIGSLGQPA
jgi:hypothetical protein